MVERMWPTLATLRSLGGRERSGLRTVYTCVSKKIKAALFLAEAASARNKKLRREESDFLRDGSSFPRGERCFNFAEAASVRPEALSQCKKQTARISTRMRSNPRKRGK